MHTYWEPLNGNYEHNWSNWAGTETDDKGISALLEAEYTVPANSVNSSGDVISVPSLRRFKQPFTVNTRELKPATGTEKPMQGSDWRCWRRCCGSLGLVRSMGFRALRDRELMKSQKLLYVNLKTNTAAVGN